MKIIDGFWRKPKTLVVVCIVTAVLFFSAAMCASQKGELWTSVFWSVFGVLSSFYGWGLYYWGIGGGARKLEEREKKRREELDDFYRGLKGK